MKKYRRVFMVQGVAMWRAAAVALWISISAPTCAVEAGFEMDTNRVITIELNMPVEDWNTLRYQHREAEFFPEEGKTAVTNAYSWLPAEVSIDGRRIARGEVRKKGYIGSNDIRRPALKLHVKPGDKDGPPLDITLNNNLQDPSLIRQSIAYEVFRRAGVPAPKCSFAVVKVNGRSLGIYTCVEPINEAFLKKHFGNSEGNLYEGGRSDFRKEWVQNFAIKSNRNNATRRDLEQATAALEGKAVLPALNDYFDAEEFFRFWAAECLINQIDGYAANVNNFYLYNNGGKFVFIPWGTDSTLYSGRALNSAPGDPKSVIGVGILANRLYNSAEGAEKYRATLRELLKTAWDENKLLREVDRIEALLSPSVESGSRDEFSANVANVRNFIKTRRSQMTPELDGPVPQLKSRPLELAKRRNIGQFSGEFSAGVGGRNRGEGKLSGRMWDADEITFDAVAVNVQTPNGSAEDRILVSVSGSAQGNNRRYMIYLAVDPESYIAGRPIAIDNTRVVGWIFGTNGKTGDTMRMIGLLRGSIEFTKADKNSGGEVAGKFGVEVFSKLPKP